MNKGSKSMKWFINTKMPITMTKTMDILIVQNFIKYLMKSYNWFITKSTNNHPTMCWRL